MPLPSHDRFPYAPIVERPPLAWPGGRRLAVYVAVALEHFPYGEGALGLSYSAGIPQPNTYNWAWREYGNRVGGWRLLELLRRHDLPPTVLLNTACYEHCPQLVAAYRSVGAEFVGHGVTNGVHPNELDEDGQRAMLREVHEAIEQAEGAPPRGWMSPGANPSRVTEDLLAEAGYRYTLDWPLDDQPVWMDTRGGPLLSVPYPHEANDVPAIVLHHSSSQDFAEIVIDTVDELLEQSTEQVLACGIVLHSFIAGQPHRLRRLRAAVEHVAGLRDRLWLTTPGAIADHYAAALPAPGGAA